MLNVTRRHTSDLVEVNSNEFAETRRVVVSYGFRITERLQHGVGLDDLVLQRDLLTVLLHRLATTFQLRLTCAHRGEVGDDLKTSREFVLRGLVKKFLMRVFRRKNVDKFLQIRRI